MSQDWHGVFPAIPTQFREDLSIDVDATMRHLDRLIAAGVHGMVVLGTIGENTACSAAEKRQILRAAVETAAGRVPVLTGVSEFTTAEACRYAADAADIGAAGGRISREERSASRRSCVKAGPALHSPRRGWI